MEFLVKDISLNNDSNTLSIPKDYIKGLNDDYKKGLEKTKGESEVFVVETNVIPEQPAIEEPIVEEQVVVEAPTPEVVADTAAVPEQPIVVETPAVEETTPIVEEPVVETQTPEVVVEAKVDEGPVVVPEGNIFDAPSPQKTAVAANEPTPEVVVEESLEPKEIPVEVPSTEEAQPVEEQPSVEQPVVEETPVMDASEIGALPDEPEVVKNPLNFGDTDYVVMRVINEGDSLYKISSDEGITVDILANHNGLTPADELQVGQFIAIPRVHDKVSKATVILSKEMLSNIQEVALGKEKNEDKGYDEIKIGF